LARFAPETVLIARRALQVGLVVLGCVVLAELVTRALGREPWRVQQAPIVVEPGGSLFEPDSRLGYRHRAGRYQVRNGSLEFTVTHGPDTLRITRPDPTPTARPGLWVFGCSLTHGWLVQDEETFPWALQQRFPRLDVVNFGVNGYGTVHGLIQLEEALATRRSPDVVVVAYASFHDDRNTFARVRRKEVVPWNHLGALSQPAARLDPERRFRIELAPFRYRELPGMRRLASLHLLEQAWTQLERRSLHPAEVTDALLDRFEERAREAGARFVLAGMWRDETTAKRLEWARARGWLAVDISFNLEDPRNSHLPWDPHPSARGQGIYAERLASFVAGKVLSPVLALPTVGGPTIGAEH
jgi:hypothetical protein